MIYTTLFLIGFIGILVMFFMGFIHVGDNGSVHNNDTGVADQSGIDDAGAMQLHDASVHSGDASLHNTPIGHTDNVDTNVNHSVDDDNIHPIHDGLNLNSVFWSLLSPMTIFSICFGTGATGILIAPAHLPQIIQVIIVLCGGFAFNGLIIRPLAKLIFGFASKPAKALDGSVSQTVHAISHFDKSGKGLVQLNVDGQIVRVLAELEKDEKGKAVAIEPGDTLTITNVDSRKNTCQVTRL